MTNKKPTRQSKAFKWYSFFAILFSLAFVGNISDVDSPYSFFSPEDLGFYAGHLYSFPEYLIILAITIWLWISTYRHRPSVSKSIKYKHWFDRYKPSKINKETAVKNVKNALTVGVVIMVLYSIVALTQDTFYWIDAFILIVFILGLRKQKVWAAVGVLIYYVFGLVVSFFTGEFTIYVGLVGLVIIHFYTSGVAGAIKLQVSLSKLAPKKKKRSFQINIFAGIGIGIGFTLLLGLWSLASDQTTSSNARAAVVNILCPEIYEPFSLDSEVSRGSGTIIDPSGLILTNYHIIPQNDSELVTHDEGCYVILPDPATGQVSEVYLAKPITEINHSLSMEYDIAYMQIYDVYVDEIGDEYGYLDEPFPYFDSTYNCYTDELTLGEEINILGYPFAGGDINLTVTEGVVSTILSDGSILTSAKLDAGNSGGLALNGEGCMIGIPTAVSEGDFDNLGVITSVDSIYTFENLAFPEEE